MLFTDFVRSFFQMEPVESSFNPHIILLKISFNIISIGFKFSSSLKNVRRNVFVSVKDSKISNTTNIKDIKYRCV